MLTNRLVAATATAAVLLGVATACGSDEKKTDYSSQSQCITAPDESQRAQLVAYQNENPELANQYASTTQVICVIEGDQQRYYREEDHFSEYLLYSMVLGRSSSLAAFGLITGDLDFGEYMALSLLAGVNSSGQVYRPYQHTNAGWGYHPTIVNNYKVKNTVYGNSKPVKYSSKSKPPAGFTVVPMPKPSDKVATVTKAANGKTELKPTGTGALKKAKEAKVSPIKPPAVKRVAPQVNVANPNASVKPSPSVAPAPATTKSTPSSKPTQSKPPASKPKATTPKKVTTKPKANAPAAPKPKVKSGR